MLNEENNSQRKGSFIVYTDIKETLDNLTDQEVADLFRGMVDYQITGEDPHFDGSLRFAFIPIRQQMDRDSDKWNAIKEKRAKAGAKGGKAASLARSKQTKQNEAKVAKGSKTKQTKQNVANQAVNVNVNDNVNVNVNDNVNVNVPDGVDAVSGEGAANAGAVASLSSLSSSLISFLNKETGSHYKATEEVTGRIALLVTEGYTEDDIRRVITKKVGEWRDSDTMRPYLRPSTLFGPKFGEYAAEPADPEIEKREVDRAALVAALKDDQGELSEVNSQLENIRAAEGGIDSAPDEYNELKLRAAILEDRIEGQSRRLEAIR